MKTSKLVMGIISMVLSLFVLFQSCAAGMLNALTANGQVSGSAGLIVAICLLIAGIVGVATRNAYGKAGALTAAGFYLAGALFGAVLAGNYTDLYFWAFLCWAFGAVYLVSAFYDVYGMESGYRWYQKEWVIILAVIFFPPAGIVLLWVSNQFLLAPKIVNTVIVTLGFLLMVGNLAGVMTAAEKTPTTTAQQTVASGSNTGGASKTGGSDNQNTATKVYGPGETWTVDGELSLTFTSATATSDRNQFSDKNPAQVVILSYDYQNIGVEKSVQDLYISSLNFSVIDAAGIVAETYPATTTGNPQPTPIGAKCVGAQQAYGLQTAGGEILVNVEVYGNNYKKHEAVFKLPVH